jgi:hypothetical protein
MLFRAVSLMQEFIGDEDVGEGNEKPTKHSVSKMLFFLQNGNAVEFNLFKFNSYASYLH